MLIPAATLAGLRDLTLTVEGSETDLNDALEALLIAVREAVPSAIGAAVTVWSLGQPVTVSTLPQHASPSAGSLSSTVTMTVDLPGRKGNVGATLSLSATAPRAFDQMIPDLSALLDMDPRRVRLTTASPAATPPLPAQLEDIALVGKALGVLLERGMLPDAGLAELARLAAMGGSTIPAAALGVLDELESSAHTSE